MMADSLLFTREHEAYRERVRDFAEHEIAPRSRVWDEENRLSMEAVHLLGKAGFLAIVASRDLGGEARDYVSLGIAVEEIAAADISCAEIVWIQNTISHFFPGWGDEALRAASRGDCVFALATSEEGAGSDVSAMKTHVVEDADAYVLNGTKTHVSLTPGADLLAVTCRLPERDGKRPIGMLRVPANAQGVTITRMEQLGARAHSLGAIELSNVRVPRSAIFGDENMAKALLNARYNVSRCLSPLAALGAAGDVLRKTIRYASQKIVFGKPIAMNQSVSFPLVEYHARIEAARLLAYKGLRMSDEGLDPSIDAAAAKWLGISCGIETIKDCLPLWGANGYLKDYPVEQKLRDVLSLNFTGGTLNIMKVLMVRGLIGPAFSGLRP